VSVHDRAKTFTSEYLVMSVIDENRTKISVIIPCYNQGRFLSDAIESVRSQGYWNVEIVVVNDGSTDDTRHVAAAYGEEIIYQEQENRGLAAARNAGIRVSTGSYVALLDSDDVLLPGSIELRARHLDDSGEIGLVCGDAIVFGDRQEEQFSLWSDFGFKPKTPEDFRWETIGFCALPSSVMFRRSCLSKTGYFDERLGKAGAEDWLMWIRLACYFSLVYVDAPVMAYRIHGLNDSHNQRKNLRAFQKAIDLLVHEERLKDYPSHFRSQLLYSRFIAACYDKALPTMVKYFAKAVTCDFGQIPYGLSIVARGMKKAMGGRMRS